MKNFEKHFEELSNLTQSANTSCKDLTKLLEKLGFEIIDCGSAGHKIAKHPAISLKEYPNFDCGHNPGTAVKRVYIKKLFKFVQLYRETLEEYQK